MTETKTKKKAARALAQAASQLQKLTPLPKIKSSKQRRRARKSVSNAVDNWVDTLNDPFDCAPIPLGFNTFNATSLGTAYYHGNDTVNATDGSFALVISPGIYSNVYLNNSGATSSTWGANSMQNRAALLNLGTWFRVISFGVRVCPLVATTSVPGSMWAGTLPMDASSVTVAGNLNTPTLLSNAASSRVGIGTYGTTIIPKPFDSTASEFLYSMTQDNFSGWETAYVAFLGLPIGTKVLYEVVCNVEVLPGNNQLVSGSQAALPVGLTNQFPSFTAAFRSVIPRLVPSVTLDFEPNVMLNKFINSRNKRATNTYSNVAVGAGTGNHMGSAFSQMADIQKQQGTRPDPDGFVQFDGSTTVDEPPPSDGISTSDIAVASVSALAAHYASVYGHAALDRYLRRMGAALGGG